MKRTCVWVCISPFPHLQAQGNLAPEPVCELVQQERGMASSQDDLGEDRPGLLPRGRPWPLAPQASPGVPGAARLQAGRQRLPWHQAEW